MAEKTFPDRVVEWFSPVAAAKRHHARIRLEMAGAMKRGFEGAALGRRTDGWRATGTDANQETRAALPRLRARAHDMRRNNAYAERAISGIASNMVGYGIIPNPKGKTTRTSSTASDLWRRWGETTACDADGRHNFYGLQYVAAEAIAESGEVLFRRRWRRAEDGLPVPFQVQMLEADFLDDSKDGLLPTGGAIVQGVEFDPLGRRSAYWLFSEHPGASGLSFGTLQSSRVPAEDVIHIYDQKRPGQVRGYTWLAPVMLRLRDFDTMEDALIQQAMIAACFAAFVTTDGGPDFPAPGVDDLIDKIEPGIVQKLGTGEAVTFGTPPTFNGYQSYAWHALHAVAVGIGVPYELLVGDLKGVNFSSGRMGWLEFSRKIDIWRWKMLIPQMCDGVWSWFNDAAALVDSRMMERIAVEWTPPRRDMIDPGAEIDARVKSIRTGHMPLTESLRELGYSNPEAVLTEYKEVNSLLDKLGLVLDCDPRRVAAAGSAVVPEQAIDASEE